MSVQPHDFNRENKEMKLRMIFAAIGVVLLTALDQLVKYIIDIKFKVGESVNLINGIFRLTYVQNRGAAWGSFSGKRIFLLIITSIILIVTIYIYVRLARRSDSKYGVLRISFVFLISGAIGNMIDRFTRGYVIDMFDFCLINFPVFNVADIFVTCSFAVIVILVLFKYKDEDISDIIKGR